MIRLLAAVAASLALIATPPIHARQTPAAASVPAVPVSAAKDGAISSMKVAFGKLTASTVIHGNALDSTAGQLSNAVVRLRDARFGRIIETQYTDQSGMFAFKSVEPGTYVVEILGNDQTILAASQLLNVNAGEAVLAVVKLPFQVPPFAQLMGTSTTQSAAMVVLQAAASGITSLVPTAPISPNQ
jgi:hypothetical protein